MISLVRRAAEVQRQLGGLRAFVDDIDAVDVDVVVGHAVVLAVAVVVAVAAAAAAALLKWGHSPRTTQVSR